MEANMTFSARANLKLFFVSVLVAAAGSANVAAAVGLGLFDQAACDDGCLSDGCDASLLDECLGTSGCDRFGCDRFGCGGFGCGDSACQGGCGAFADFGIHSGGIMGWLDRRGGVLGQLIKPSDRCFDDFISPMINFVHFEDPRTLTETRTIFVNHWVPETIGSGVSAGGTIQLLATQFRVALTDRLSLIGVKDGYIWDNTEGTLDTLLDDGWASVTAGLKYNVLRDVQSGTLASVGGTYEIPLGSEEALQAIGDGEFHLFMTGGQRLFDGNAHVLSAFGWRVPADGAVQAESVHWSNHFDVRLTRSLYVLTEVEWWHWVDSAEAGLPIGVEGQDLFNLSASDVTGNNLVSQNVGLRWKPSRATVFGIAYEFPLSEFKDVLDNRLQLEMILRY
jgi:hypothetical protein